MDKKLKIGWFSFSCCEDSTIIFTELLNSRYLEWKNKLDFVHAKVLKRSPKVIPEMDIAFVEGAITSDSQEKKLREIRSKAKLIVAIGACAVIGSPSNQRNFFNAGQSQEIREILEKFKYSEKVQKVADVVKVDEVVPGCPMNEEIFLNIVNKYINS